MARHFNPSIVEWFNRIFRPKAGDTIGDEVLPYITPTMEIRPTCNIIKSVTGSGDLTLYTTPTDKNFYLTNINISARNTALTTFSRYNIGVVIRGVVSNPGFLQAIPSVANVVHLEMKFDPPLLLDRGSAVSASGDATCGEATMTLIGYTEETTANI